jgi:16S rRNA (guanine527-N7)-methyltransferase
MPPAATPDQIGQWLHPYLEHPAPPALLNQLALYLDLLLRWNARINLTAIREPRAIVERHFGESLFAARHVPTPARTLLDHGSGAGFPGLPIALARPDLAVTLSESQSKKVAFLREAVRTLSLPNVEIHPARTESLPATQKFDCVTLRAVDIMPHQIALCRPYCTPAGSVLFLCSKQLIINSLDIMPTAIYPLPNQRDSVLAILPCS